MRSSPAYAGLALELPSVTVANRLAAALAIGAGTYGANVLAGQGATAAGVVVACAGLAAAGVQVANWTRARTRPGLRLELRPDGSLQVRAGTGTAVPATLGGGTRRVGPSVFLDVHFAIGGRTRQYRRWLTPLDVPAAVLRRWSVVLPRSGRAACS